MIPPEALAIEEGQQVCYVVGPDGPVRRPVEIGTGTPELLEVRAGLSEGEEVLLEPEAIAEAIAAAADRPPAPSGVVVAGTPPPL